MCKAGLQHFSNNMKGNFQLSFYKLYICSIVPDVQQTTQHLDIGVLVEEQASSETVDGLTDLAHTLLHCLVAWRVGAAPRGGARR